MLLESLGGWSQRIQQRAIAHAGAAMLRYRAHSCKRRFCPTRGSRLRFVQLAQPQRSGLKTHRVNATNSAATPARELRRQKRQCLVRRAVRHLIKPAQQSMACVAVSGSTVCISTLAIHRVQRLRNERVASRGNGLAQTPAVGNARCGYHGGEHWLGRWPSARLDFVDDAQRLRRWLHEPWPRGALRGRCCRHSEQLEEPVRTSTTFVAAAGAEWQQGERDAMRVKACDEGSMYQGDHSDACGFQQFI
mmetsp:Transcript_54303/g.151147  ORF Transcript_54303/g.151147 Transcript_54303/m.151147 type:complete len:248 (+) Transcript_54303:316-1059(+)